MSIRRLLYASALIGPALSAHAEMLTSDQLKDVRETATGICNSVRDIKGQKNEFQIQGDVKAQLGGLAGRLADAGVSGQGSIGRSEFEGLTQEATAIALSGDRDCRERLFNKMFDQATKASPTAPKPSPYVSAPPPPSSSLAAPRHDLPAPNPEIGAPIQAAGRVVNVEPYNISARVSVRNISGYLVYIAIEGDKNISVGNCTRDAANSQVSGVGVGIEFARGKVVWSNSVEIHRALTQVPSNTQVIISFSIPYCELADPQETDISFPLFVSLDSQVGISQNVSVSAPVQRQGARGGQAPTPFR